MADTFTKWNMATHPVWKLEDDLNNMLDHGLEKSPSCIVRLNGSYYEGIDGSTGKLMYGGANNTGGVDGTDLEAIMTAVLAAAHYIFVKTGGTTITWTTASVAANKTIEADAGEHFVIQASATPDVDEVSIGSGTTLINVSVYDSAGVAQGLVPNAARLVKFYYNARSIAQDSNHYQNTFALVDLADATVDRAAIAVNNYGVGDGYWCGNQDNGVGIHMWVDNLDQAKTGTGLYISFYGAGKGFWAVSQTGATGTLAMLSSYANVTALEINAGVATTNDLIITSAFKTAGQMINLAQGTSAFAGTGLYMGFGGGAGTFTGNFFVCANATVEKWRLNYEGQMNQSTVLGAATGDLYTGTTSTKTGGHMIALYHTTSNWAAGYGLIMNFGDGVGSFGGAFCLFEVADDPRFEVQADGDVKVYAHNAGYIVQDRTTHAYVRVFVDGGVVGVEAE